MFWIIDFSRPRYGNKKLKASIFFINQAGRLDS